MEHLGKFILFFFLISNIFPKFKMFSLRDSFSPNSYLNFLVRFVLSHEGFFSQFCSFCPFGSCYKPFIEFISLFQIVSKILFEGTFLYQIYFQGYSIGQIIHLLETFDSPADVMLRIPYFNVPITHQKFDLIRHSINAYSCGELFFQALTSTVSWYLLFCLDNDKN